MRLEQRLKAQAYALGFDLCGITRLGVPQSYEFFERWLSLGRAGTMEYLSRYQAQRGDSRLAHPGATTAIVVAMNYGGRQPNGPIARYARGDDYHDVMRDRLRSLLTWLETDVGRPIDARPFVDTAPILERDLARRAGLGWIGKNTNLINPRVGSFFFIGSLFVNLVLATDVPFEADRCGTCRRCIDACPTDAIVAPHELDARLCVSYLTIELRDDIPPELRSRMGELVYGCDICQEVCPWNVKFAEEATEPRLLPRPENVAPDPAELLALNDDEFRVRFRRSAIKRTKRRGLARNAAVALGNRGDLGSAPALIAALDDPVPLVREHSAWALERISTTEA
jgi:epoxyqueuosine reductase